VGGLCRVAGKGSEGGGGGEGGEGVVGWDRNGCGVGGLPDCLCGLECESHQPEKKKQCPFADRKVEL